RAASRLRSEETDSTRAPVVLSAQAATIVSARGFQWCAHWSDAASSASETSPRQPPSRPRTTDSSGGVALTGSRGREVTGEERDRRLRLRQEERIRVTALGKLDHAP